MKNFIRIAGLLLSLAFGAAAQNKYAGIYFCDLSGDYYNNLAVIVRTNNQATLVGSAFGTNSSVGMYAAFTVQNDGTWTCQTIGFSAHGQVFTNGTLSGGVDWTDGSVSTIDNGTLQDDSGPFQNAAGYYAGTWWGGGHNGNLFGILTAFGELTYCVLNGVSPVDGGGPDPLDETSRSFASFSVNNTELDGTLTNGTLTIGGTFTSADSTPVHGHFRMSRAAFVPRNLPPTITSPPVD